MDNEAIQPQHIAVITGASGMDGSLLVDNLLNRGDWRVFALVRRRGSGGFPKRLIRVRGHTKLHIVYGDVTDAPCMDGLIGTACSVAFHEGISPRNIAMFNLAANSFVGDSWKCPEEHVNTSVGGLLNILRAVSTHTPKSFVYQASTSEIFGSSPPPQNVQTPFRPLSPYAVAKLAAHNLAGCYRNRGTNVWCGIMFNHEHERRGMEFVTQKLAFHTARIARGIGPKHMTVGDLSSIRDWGNAREYVKAMVEFYLLSLRGVAPQDVVIGTGKMTTCSQFFQWCCECAKKHIRGRYEVTSDSLVFSDAFKRPNDVRELLADTSQIQKLLPDWSGGNAQEIAEDMTRHWMDATEEEILNALVESPA